MYRRIIAGVPRAEVWLPAHTDDDRGRGVPNGPGLYPERARGARADGHVVQARRQHVAPCLHTAANQFHSHKLQQQSKGQTFELMSVNNLLFRKLQHLNYYM